MKSQVVVAVAALMATGIRTSQASQTREPNVTVCMATGGEAFGLVQEAQATVDRMFAATGVVIEWRPQMRDCPANAILVSLSYRTPESLSPGALASARPFEGIHIEVFYDRIRRFNHAAVPTVLAHVLVHEITHVLQAVSRHSDYGVMKAQWDTTDYTEMRWKTLAFTPNDVDLIHQGMASRPHLAPIRIAAAH